MNKKINFIPIFSFILLACSINIVKAQGVQNFVNNEENKIQQDIGAGALNAKQASAVQNQQAAIMSQETQDKNLNGGHLTQQERQQIAGEERQLKNNVNQNVYQNNPNAVINNGNYTNWNRNNPNWQQQQNWPNNWSQNQNNNPNVQSNSYNGREYRRHRSW